MICLSKNICDDHYYTCTAHVQTALDSPTHGYAGNPGVIVICCDRYVEFCFFQPRLACSINFSTIRVQYCVHLYNCCTS